MQTLEAPCCFPPPSSLATNYQKISPSISPPSSVCMCVCVCVCVCVEREREREREYNWKIYETKKKRSPKSTLLASNTRGLRTKPRQVASAAHSSVGRGWQCLLKARSSLGGFKCSSAPLCCSLARLSHQIGNTCWSEVQSTHGELLLNGSEKGRLLKPEV